MAKTKKKAINIKNIKMSKVDIVLLIIFALIISLVIMLFSYAYYTTDINTYSISEFATSADCINVTYSESNTINLNNVLPTDDYYAYDNLTPVRMTLTNNCHNEIPINITLNSISQKGLSYDNDYIPTNKMRVILESASYYYGVYIDELQEADKTSRMGSKIVSNFNSTTQYNNYDLQKINYFPRMYLKPNEVMSIDIWIYIDLFEGNKERQRYESDLYKKNYTDKYDNSTSGKKYEAYLGYVANLSNKNYLNDAVLASGQLWQSGLEDDGYRYTGTAGVFCYYDSGSYIITGPEDYSCPTLYNYTKTTISSGATSNSTYQTSCPANDATYTYSCTTLNPDVSAGDPPKNYICFGTTSQSDCMNNPDKYMYRIIGVFKDSYRDNYVKVIKYKQIGAYQWDDTNTNVDWSDSSLYNNLDSTYFFDNSSYSYMQDYIWYNKIARWKWVSVNTSPVGQTGPMYYNEIDSHNVYLHEMNKSGKVSDIGTWYEFNSKIGLLYASDYSLSLGQESLTYVSLTNANVMKESWLHQSSNDTTQNVNEWTMTYLSETDTQTHGWLVHNDGYLYDAPVTNVNGVRPVFYLEKGVICSGGNGTINDPYMIDSIDEEDYFGYD